MTENELKILMKETETREPTEEEIDKLRELFWEKYGQASYGMCLHPYWLLHNPFDELDIETIEYESEEVKAWLEQGTLDLFDEQNTRNQTYIESSATSQTNVLAESNSKCLQMH